MIRSENVFDTCVPRESVTRTVKEKSPRRLGVPETTPDELSVNPFGSLPDVRAHVYGPTPPVAARVCE